MPDPIDLDLAELDRRRTAVADVEGRQTALRAELAARTAELELLRRRSAAAEAISRAEARVASLEETRASLRDRRADLLAGVGDLADGLVAGLDPGRAVAALDGRVPVALLPVRIETRFGLDHTTLDIRLYPDQIHLDAHEPQLTADERQGGEWYWQQRWPDLADGPVAEAAWGTLASRFRPGRARYLVDTLRPTNLEAGTAELPDFPDTESRAATWTRAVEATALPERWVAVGYQGDVEVFRVWSSRVPDRLAAGPTPAIEEAPSREETGEERTIPLVQEAFRWAVDRDAAGAAGMVVTVRDADLAAGHRLAAGLTRLVVLGVDWTLTPEQAAGSLSALLAGHAATGDLAFVEPGTPTNNTGTGRSGFSSAPADQVAAWAPPLTGEDPDVAADRAAGRLAAALGIPPAALAAVPGAGDRHQVIASALVDALWEATGGYYATELLNPLGSDELTHRLRIHAAAHLQPSGPLPILRVGRQPYGVLPVVASRYRPTPGDQAEQAIVRVGAAFRGLWEPLTARLPHLGRAGEQRHLDDLVLELLQRTPVPWSMRWREMVPPPQWSSSDWMESFRTYQAPYLDMVMQMLGVPNTGAARIQYLAATDDSHPLHVPLVVKGAEGTSYLAEIAALTRDGSNGRRELNLRQNSIALLEALVAFAAVQEMDKAASAERLVDRTVEARALAGFERIGVRTPDLIRVEQPDPGAPLRIGTARELAASTIPATGVLVHDRMAERLATSSIGDLVRDRLNPANGVARFLAALDVLGPAPAPAIEWAFRGVLDLYSTRLDAWLTSLATARLGRHRAARPRGVHLGCYGWVEDLHPDSGAAAETLGHVLAPSLAHAVGAAVLRSGRQAHAGTGAFDIDVSSARVRQAIALLEGVASGQSIAALVGYRIERRLRDLGLADLTVPLRLEAPLQSRDSEHEGPVESVAARNVVDGVRLLSLFSESGEAWERIVTRIGVGNRRPRLEAVLREVASHYDAVTDVLFAETVHQTATGNLERAGAAAAALDRFERPIEPEVIRTPREGATVTNRMLLSLRGTSPAPAWPARRIRGAAEPRLDSWLGSLLGEPAALTVRGRLHRPSSDPGGDELVTDLGTVSAADLDLSPLALVLTAQRPAAAGFSELDARIRLVLQDRVADLAAGDRIAWDEHSILHTVTGWAARLAGNRPLAPTDLALPQAAATTPAGTVDLAELTARVDEAIAAVRTIHDAVASSARTATALRRALLSASELVGDEALPAVAPGAADEARRLGEQADGVVELLARRLDAVGELAGRELGENDPVGRRLELAALALGAHQPVLPVCTLAAPEEAAASVGDRAALLGGDETAAVAWLHRASLVRPDLDPLCGLLTHAEAAGRDVVADVAVTQLPHVPGARWCELPHGEGGPPPAGTVGIVVVAPEGFDPTAAQAGLFVDAWAEVIPSPDHTAGLAFHYDAPGARPPQAIVLAVHPEPDPERWDLETLLETVAETAALARLRGLSLKETDGFSGLLPALFLPNNYTRDVPSVSFKGLMELAAARELLATTFTGIRGK